MLLEAIQTHWECGRTSYIPDSLFRLAWIAVDRCNLSHAVRLIAAAEAWYIQMAVSLTAAEQALHQPRLEFAKSALTQSQFEMFWQEGQDMGCKAAVDYVLRGLMRTDR